MRFLAVFSYSTKSVGTVIPENKPSEPEAEGKVHESEVPLPSSTEPPTESEETSEPSSVDPKDLPLPASPASTQSVPDTVCPPPESKANLNPISGPVAHKIRIRRFSFRPFSFTRAHEGRKPTLSTIKDHEKKLHANVALSKPITKPRSSNSEKRAKDSALIVRSLIVGHPASSYPQVAAAIAKPHLNKIKSQLMQPKSANKLIAQLRVLPISDELVEGKDSQKDEHNFGPAKPIHAVCLVHTDAEEHALHFAALAQKLEGSEITARTIELPGISSIPIDKLTSLFDEMHIIDLIASPDLGLGQPGDGPGILAGAVPTAETVLKGFEQITPQLMALGYATGKAVAPNHAGIYPPKDRISVLTYWWGIEIVLPPPSLEYLSSAQSITDAVINCLSALALVNNGVREILPFIRYISQYINFEFNAIRGQNKGKGVVCAATWIMPAAMVPRPWDFLDPPLAVIQPIKDRDDDTNLPTRSLPTGIPLPFTVPRPLPSLPQDALPVGAIAPEESESQRAVIPDPSSSRPVESPL